MANLKYDANDIAALALCAWREARGEGVDGMHAVMHVICKRAAMWYAHSDHPIHEAIYAKNQFTSMSVPSDPEFHLMPDAHDPLYVWARSTAPYIVAGSEKDPTNGAMYYANIETMDEGGWFYRHIFLDHRNHPLLAKINHHSFFA